MSQNCQTCEGKPSTLRTTTITHMHEGTLLSLTNFPVFYCSDCKKQDIIESTRETFIRKAIKQFKENKDTSYICDFKRF
jgi:hypothetical protein